MSEEIVECSFCERNQDQVLKIIVTHSTAKVKAFICDECISVCAAILSEDSADYAGYLCAFIMESFHGARAQEFKTSLQSKRRGSEAEPLLVGRSTSDVSPDPTEAKP